MASMCAGRLLVIINSLQSELRKEQVKSPHEFMIGLRDVRSTTSVISAIIPSILALITAKSIGSSGFLKTFLCRCGLGKSRVYSFSSMSLNFMYFSFSSSTVSTVYTKPPFKICNHENEWVQVTQLLFCVTSSFRQPNQRAPMLL